MLRHAVVIRFHYSPDDPRFSWRFAFFKSMVLPRLLNQTDQDFEIWLVCHPAHEILIGKLDRKINICTIPEFPSPETFRLVDMSALAQFDIQTSFDTDDLVSLNYIEKIKAEITNNLGRTLLVTFQPYKLDILSLKRYKMWERYGNGKCSMFFSLYQPDKSNYRSVFDFDHSYIGGWCNNIICIPEGYCDMVIHGANWMTHLQPNLGEV